MGLNFSIRMISWDIQDVKFQAFFTQEELQLEMDGCKQRIPLENVKISDDITNRPYQKEAVTAVCDAIMNKHRKMLIVQATIS